MGYQTELKLKMICTQVIFKAFIATSYSNEDGVCFERTVASVTSNEVHVLLDMHDWYPNVQHPDQLVDVEVQLAVSLWLEQNRWFF